MTDEKRGIHDLLIIALLLSPVFLWIGSGAPLLTENQAWIFLGWPVIAYLCGYRHGKHSK